MAILIIEDELVVALDIRMALESQGYDEILVATSGEEAVVLAETNTIDLMLIDYRLAGKLNGEEVASAIRSHFGKAIPVIFVSGTADKEIVNRLAIHPCTFVKKPIIMEELVDCVKSILSDIGNVA